MLTKIMLLMICVLMYTAMSVEELKDERQARA